MKIEAATRRANFWLFVGLVAFAILLCVLVFSWMRVRTHAEGGKVYPPVTLYQFCYPERSVMESKDLPTAGMQGAVSADSRKVLRLRSFVASLRMTERFEKIAS